MKSFISTILLLLVISTQSGVMEITLNNLRNVIATYESIFILFHNPQCSHSRKYVESFLKIDSDEKLGLVDCLREIQLCSKHNFTQFPVLTKISNPQEKPQVIDEQKFLLAHGLRDGTEDDFLVNTFLGYLDQDPSYAVVVFQDYGLPAIEKERISSTKQRIFYLQPYNDQNPSNFTKLLSSFVNNKPGCWIFSKIKQNQLEKYSCDSGYDKSITQKFISLFKEKKLKRYVFSEEAEDLSTSKSVIKFNAQQMYETLKQVERADSTFCAMVYFSSKNCPSCRSSDISNVETILKTLKIENQVGLAKFSVDQNEIPQKLIQYGLKRVPELIYFCNQKIKVFGEIFYLSSLRTFLEKHHLNMHQEVKFEQPSKNQQKTENNQQEM